MLSETSSANTRSIPLRSTGATLVPICGPEAAKISKINPLKVKDDEQSGDQKKQDQQKDKQQQEQNAQNNSSDEQESEQQSNQNEDQQEDQTKQQQVRTKQKGKRKSIWDDPFFNSFNTRTVKKLIRTDPIISPARTKRLEEIHPYLLGN